MWVPRRPVERIAYDSVGNTYYAYLEVNTVTGATTAFAGNTCSISSTHGKYLVYPGDAAVTSTVDKKNGVVDLTVPLSDVGTPPLGATLYSVTAHTVGQLNAAGGPGSCTRDPNGNDQDPTGQIFDVYDKSPAYTSRLTAPIQLVITGGGHQSGKTVKFHWTVVSGPKPKSFKLLAVFQGGSVKRMNKHVIAAHRGKSYSFVAHHVKADVDLFSVNAKVGRVFISTGPFVVTG